jgi:integrase
MVKGWCRDVGLKGNYGSHTLRKTWGFWQYQQRTPIPLLMEAFGHQTQRQTLAYLGIQAPEIAQIYQMEL